ncbi:Pentatricopeptide repeat-containing protein [Vigna angularis]|uniref:Pentatricopeptide repeat-containing protein n=1 Tax=Phaseolus angularis TaxID=3914 RepID=A0A8T0LAS2_PHAAN|nr:Pentatricopeptide repeat-containing protein [Vigna angularis]
MSLYKTIPQFNYVNWTESFNTILQIMVNENRLEMAHHLFVESSCGWEVRSRVRALNLLMYALCQKSRSDLALQLFQEMDYQSCYPNRDSYAILMKGLCQDRRLHEATHLLYTMFWRISQKGNGEDIVVYRTLLDALCDAGKLEEAVEILDRGFRPIHSIFEEKVAALCKVSKVNEAIKVIEEDMVKVNCLPTARVYNILLKSLYNVGNSMTVLESLNKMSNKVCGGKPTSGNALWQYEAVMWLEDMMSQGKLLETSVWNSLASLFCNSEKIKVSSQTFSRLSGL